MMPLMAQQANRRVVVGQVQRDPAAEMRFLDAIPASRELQISSLPFPELLLVSTPFN
jgi:hypothetical protein